MNASLPPNIPVSAHRAALARSHSSIAGAARWFWWIAGLSVVNSVVSLTGGSFNFVLGLAVTQIAEAVFHPLPVLALLLDAAAVLFFIAAGVLARRGWLCAFVVGGLIYALDGAVFAWFGDWLAAGFHAFALYHLFRGWRDLRDLLRHAGTAHQTPLVPAAPVALAEPGTPPPASQVEGA